MSENSSTIHAMDPVFCVASRGPHLLILARGDVQERHIRHTQVAMQTLARRYDAPEISSLTWVFPKQARMSADVRQHALQLVDSVRNKGRKSAIVIEGNGPLIAGVRALATVMQLASQRRAQRIFAYLEGAVNWLCDNDDNHAAPLYRELLRLDELQLCSPAAQHIVPREVKIYASLGPSVG